MGFYGFLRSFGLQDTFQERIAPKPVEIDQDKLDVKFSALNIDFNVLNLDFLGSRKPAHEGIKDCYPRNSHYFTMVGQSFVKLVADTHGHAAYHNSTRDELFSHIKIDEFGRP